MDVGYRCCGYSPLKTERDAKSTAHAQSGSVNASFEVEGTSEETLGNHVTPHRTRTRVNLEQAENNSKNSNQTSKDNGNSRVCETCSKCLQITCEQDLHSAQQSPCQRCKDSNVVWWKLSSLWGFIDSKNEESEMWCVRWKCFCEGGIPQLAKKSFHLPGMDTAFLTAGSVDPNTVHQLQHFFWFREKILVLQEDFLNKPKFLHFGVVFRKKIGQIIGWQRSTGGWRPPSGKSWIRHCWMLPNWDNRGTPHKTDIHNASRNRRYNIYVPKKHLSLIAN